MMQHRDEIQMEMHDGVAWPLGTTEHYRNAYYDHMRNLDWSLRFAASLPRSTAIQAGGNIGLWPQKMADAGVFYDVHTFEPMNDLRECMHHNIGARDDCVIHSHALGTDSREVAMQRLNHGGHYVSPIATATQPARMVSIDGAIRNGQLCPRRGVSLIQLDLEGYEFMALVGALDTIKRWHPVLHLELANFGAQRYEISDSNIRSLLYDLGYRQAVALPNDDYVFVHDTGGNHAFIG